MRFGPDYYNARQMQTALFKTVCDEKTPARDAAQCTRAWIDLERLKREMRGIPPLAVSTMKEIQAFKQIMLKSADAKDYGDTEPTETE